ncbi:MAG: Txe/YoeB family addiction module toxin [Oscillospiraceae bacterium]|nr:Txe/YoeB family addiction module toxin [Oscillospiraceae bacterium]
MSDNVNFTKRGLSDYIYWQDGNKRTLNKLNKLIYDVKRNYYEGLGKPEQLKGNFSGCWSREIDEKNRLVYRITEDDDVEILQCKGHYNDK